jgi:hypothetical protein
MRANGSTPDDMDPLARIARYGWTADSRALQPWLDRVFAAPWVKILEELDRKPPGVFDDPRTVDYFSPTDMSRDLHEMTLAIRARGAQQADDGKPEAYAQLLPGGLAAVRTARNKSGARTPEFAIQCEELLLRGLGEWLERLDGRADLLRDLLTLLDRHEREMPVGGQESYWADQIILRNTLDRVGNWLPKYLEGPRPDERAKARAEAESDLVAVSWSFPWERVRRERILRVHTHYDRKVDPNWVSGLHLMNSTLWRKNQAGRLAPLDRRGLTSRRLARLQVALRLYNLERGEPAARLDQLVPAYMSEIPADPYSTGRFGYRLSNGEHLESLGNDSEEAIREAAAMDFLAAIIRPGGAARAFAIVVRAASPRPSGPGIGVGGLAVNMAGPGMAIPPPPPPRRMRIPPGTGILWSAGNDGKDDGGRRITAAGANTGTGEDWIILIPPMRPKRN